MTRLPVGVCAHLDGEERTAERVSSQYCVLTVSRHLTIVIRNYELFFVILYFSFLILKLFLKSDIFTWKFVAKQKVFFSLSVCVCLASGCPPGWFGEDCVQRCNCSNGGVCDSASGNCTCGLGWTGEHCDRGDNTFISCFFQCSQFKKKKIDICFHLLLYCSTLTLN